MTNWTIPVETIFNGDTGEEDYVITLPPELLEKAGWKENDDLEWIDRGDGSYELRKFDPPELSVISPSTDSFPSRY